ncbi:MAG: GatB/YqeY domain-containing protein, partial [bacterium]
TGQRDLGKVMGAIIPKTRGRADGRTVNKIVRELLEH